MVGGVAVLGRNCTVAESMCGQSERAQGRLGVDGVRCGKAVYQRGRHVKKGRRPASSKKLKLNLAKATQASVAKRMAGDTQYWARIIENDDKLHSHHPIL